MMDDLEAELGITHRGGVWWNDAPLPPRWHRCRAQSTGLGTARCACGAIRTPYGWADRNSRRGPWWRFGK